MILEKITGLNAIEDDEDWKELFPGWKEDPTDEEELESESQYWKRLDEVKDIIRNSRYEYRKDKNLRNLERRIKIEGILKKRAQTNPNYKYPPYLAVDLELDEEGKEREDSDESDDEEDEHKKTPEPQYLGKDKGKTPIRNSKYHIIAGNLTKEVDEQLKQQEEQLNQKAQQQKNFKYPAYVMINEPEAIFE
jgi:hypothetical protein